MSQDEILYLWAQWGTLNHQSYQLVLRTFGDLETAWKNITPAFFQKLGMRQEKTERIFHIKERLSFQTIISQLEENNVTVLPLNDPQYPEPLKHISDPPLFLFVRGQLPPFHKSIAIVGTRAMTSYGHYATERFTRHLVQNGFVTISGLALGVDACAHETTLAHHGKTVAVLGSGVDQIYPATNRRLSQRIIDSGGAIVSTYPLGTPPAKHHFPERNVIVSALSKGVLVTEGGIKSGALITARMALEQNREVFAVPSPITKTVLSGTNHLIRKGEAKLVESVKDILEEFEMTEQAEPLALEFEPDEKPLLQLLSAGPKTMDELLLRSEDLGVATLSQKLIELSLKGAIKQQGNRWVIA